MSVKTTEIRVKVDSKYLEKLLSLLKEEKATEATRDALTLLNWAAKEAALGRVIVSVKPDGTDVTKLAMPALEKVGV